MRSIVHLDADAFFASVEQASDPRLRGKAIAVGGEKRGIIASASYEARKFGIYTPMPSIMARRLCPKLILVPGDFEKYELFSRLMFSYAYDFTPDVEIGSIDEGYFDLTGTRKPAADIAGTIRLAIRQSLKLSVSEGVAANKLVSQIASKLKKPYGFEIVPQGGEAPFLSVLPNKWLPGIGPKTATQLNSAGLALVGQIAQTPVDLLGLLVGRTAFQLRNFARGIDERPVIPVRVPAKSYGEQETFSADTTDEEFLTATLRRMADSLMAKVRDDGKSIRTLTVKVRYNDMDEEQAAESLNEPTDLETDIYSQTSALLRKAWRRRVSLRLVSLKLSNVYDGRFRSNLALDVSTRQHQAQQRLAGTVDELRQKYGRKVLLRGHDFILRTKGGRGVEPEMKQRKAAREQALPTPALTGGQHETKESEVQEKKSRFGTEHVQISNLKSQISNLSNRKSQIANRKSPMPYVERQRLGNSFARIMSSPGVELRFRMETQSGCTKFQISNLKSQISSIPLNVHSYYSFLDSTLSIKAIVELARRHRLPAIALTDKQNLHGAVEFTQTAIAAGIKPIIGTELDWQGHHLCLYAENQTGYHNLCQILNTVSAKSTASDERGPGFTNLFPFPTEGLIAVSPAAELAPFFPNRFYLETNSLEAYEKRRAPLPCVASFPVHYEKPADRWKYNIVQSIRTLTLLRQEHPEKRLDGECHFRPDPEMQKLFGAHPELLAHSLEIAERCSFAFTFGKPQFPSYPTPDGSSPADYLRRLVMDGLKFRYPNDYAQRKAQLEEELAIILEVGYEEYFLVMWDILQECRQRGIEWITRGSAADSLACYCLEISSVCPIRFDLYFRRFLNRDRMALNKLPDIDVDFPHDRKDDVIDLIFEKYGPSSRAAVVGGFSTFQSRSAFAEVAKVLGVSEYQVRRLTERLPHFSRASELTEAVADTLECRDLPLDQEPYSTALQMAQFLDGFPRYPKMHPCGLVLSRQPMHEITPCFTSAKGYSTTHFDMDSIEAVGLIKMDILAQGGLAVMRDVLESVPGTGISESGNEESKNVRDFPIEFPSPLPSPKGRGNSNVRLEEIPVTYVSPTDCRTSSLSLRERVGPSPRRSGYGRAGGVRGVSDFELRASNLGMPSTMGPFDDPQVWDLISGGSARAVHHIESPAMISLCRMCNVQDIDTLIAIVSVIRPGAANESKKMEFARRYQGLSPVRYPHPSLELCLRSTYGLVVYEEHILQICEAFAGLPPGRADILRRALGKDKTDIINQIQIEFGDCARRRGRTESEITEVWELVVGFRGYAFCKAHSTAYGVEAYQSAWLKLRYPAEFMAAVLTNGKGFYDPLVYVLECHRLGIPLLPPSINEPGPQFSVVVDHGLQTTDYRPQTTDRRPNTQYPAAKIRVPVLLVKGLTNRTKETVLHERAHCAFSSLADFVLRVQPLAEEMEALIRVGAFDVFGQSRTTQYWQFKSICYGNSQAKNCNASETAGGRDGALRRPRAVQARNGLDKNNFYVVPPLDAAATAQRAVSTTLNTSFPSNPTPPPSQLWLLPPGNLGRLPSVPLVEPERLHRLRAEEELIGYPVSSHPLELFPDIAWDTYCPVNRLADHVGEQVVTCGLVIEQRLFHQVTGEPMKFLTLADWTGVVETELFARTYKSYGLNTIRYRVLEITATVEPFENGRGFTLRVLRAGKPRTKTSGTEAPILSQPIATSDPGSP
jgi:DNA polymerase III alpha subunit/nucleotidyltransferase/DNA polymerase involved in DNA repair